MLGLVFVVVACFNAEPVRRIVIDGNFDDWDNVPKRADPFRASASTSSPMDGIPPAPDVHDTDTTADTCFVRKESFNPWCDVVEVALAHDENQFFAYFKSVKSMAFTTSGDDGMAGRLYVQVERSRFPFSLR
jgi:hypothetical protein